MISPSYVGISLVLLLHEGQRAGQGHTQSMCSLSLPNYWSVCSVGAGNTPCLPGNCGKWCTVSQFQGAAAICEFNYYSNLINDISKLIFGFLESHLQTLYVCMFTNGGVGDISVLKPTQTTHLHVIGFPCRKESGQILWWRHTYAIQ